MITSLASVVPMFSTTSVSASSSRLKPRHDAHDDERLSLRLTCSPSLSNLSPRKDRGCVNATRAVAICATAAAKADVFASHIVDLPK